MTIYVELSDIQKLGAAESWPGDSEAETFMGPILRADLGVFRHTIRILRLTEWRAPQIAFMIWDGEQPEPDHEKSPGFASLSRRFWVSDESKAFLLVVLRQLVVACGFEAEPRIDLDTVVMNTLDQRAAGEVAGDLQYWIQSPGQTTPITEAEPTSSLPSIAESKRLR